MKFVLSLVSFLVCFLMAGVDCAGKPDQALSAGEISSQIKRSANNPTALYKHLTEYRDQHIDPQAALVCFDVLQKQPNNAVLKAAFAFLWFRAVHPLSENYSDYSKKTSTLTAVIALHLKADQCREDAVKKLPNSPEVLLETGIAECYQVSANYNTRLSGSKHIQQAVKLAPKWADAHYWLANSLNLLEGKVYDDAAKKGINPKTSLYALANEELFHYNKAEELNPNLHNDCLLGYAFAYNTLEQPIKSQQALETYIKINPWFLKAPGVAQWREQIIRKAKGNP